MTTVIKIILNRWINAGIIKKSDEDVYIYGLDLILFSILNLIAILITATFFGKLLESLLLMIAIIPIQAYGGGYHAKTHLRCFLIMYIGWWIVMFILPLVTPIIATVLSIMAVLLTFILAPVSHVNVPMSIGRKLQLRKYVRIVVSVISASSLIFMWTPILINADVGIVLSVGISIASLSMLLAHTINFIQTK